MHFYAISQRPWVEDDSGGHWGLPGGTIGSVDLSASGAHDRLFVASDEPFEVGGDILATFGDGTHIDIYVPNDTERAAWQDLIGVPHQPGWTLLDLLWHTLTDYADPYGQTGPKPIMPTREGVLELHLGGHSLVRAERLPDDPTTHPAWPKIQAVKQRTYRDLRAQDAIVARKWLDNERYRFRLHPKAARDLLIPSDLPRELPLPRSTTYTESFAKSNGAGLGPDLTWTIVAGNWSTTSGRATNTEGGSPTAWPARAEHDLSSDDHYAAVELWNNSDFHAGGTSVRHDTASDTRYVGIFQTAPDFDNHHLAKIVNGTKTTFDLGVTFTPANGDVCEVRADGSTISLRRNGTVIHSVTDSEITGFTRAGITGKNNIHLDNFVAEDLLVEATYSLSGQASLGAISAVGEASQTIPSVSMAGGFSAASPSAAGEASATVPALTLSGTGSLSAVAAEGEVGATVPGFDATGQAGLASLMSSGSASATIPEFSTAGQVEVSRMVASGTASAPEVEFSMTGTASLAAVSGAGVADYAELEYGASGQASLSPVSGEGSASFAEPGFVLSGQSALLAVESGGGATAEVPVWTAAGTSSPSPLVASGQSSAVVPTFSSSGSASTSPVVAGGEASQTIQTFDLSGSSFLTAPIVGGQASAAEPGFALTGQATLSPATTDGDASAEAPVFSSSGSFSLLGVAAAGTADHVAAEVTASGGAGLASLVSIGVSSYAVPGFVASGGIVLSPSEAAGSSSVTVPVVSGDGSASLDPPVAGGEAGHLVPVFGLSGGASLVAVQSAGEASAKRPATGAASLEPVQASGVASSEVPEWALTGKASIGGVEGLGQVTYVPPGFSGAGDTGLPIPVLVGTLNLGELKGPIKVIEMTARRRTTPKIVMGRSRAHDLVAKRRVPK